MTMDGHWRPSAARAEFEAHEAKVAEELSRLHEESAAAWRGSGKLSGNGPA